VRKLTTTILTRRLSTIIEKNKILKGNNFGFRPGKSTNDNITIIKNIIDIANIRKQPLFIGNLDIKKAYDTVPPEAMRMAYRRIKIPETYIKLIMTMNDQRTLKIITPYGPTEEINPKIGLPQGDISSPLDWLIFYDPLLCMLENHSDGFKISNDLSISAIAYADDLNPIAQSRKDLQKQLDIIHRYLKFHKMMMRPSKCAIYTNYAPLSKEFQDLSLIPITLNDAQLTIHPEDSIIRILGVYLTLDGKSKETINRCLHQVKITMKIINKKYVPGQIATKIINSVLFPRILYQLQITPVPNLIINTIMIIAKKYIKKAFLLNKNTNNHIIFNKEYGIKLKDLRELLDQQLLNNTLVHIRSQSLTGIVMRKCLKETSKGRINEIFSAPIDKIPGNSDNLIKYISHRLFYHKMTFRTLKETDSLSNVLSMTEYNLYHKHLKTFNILNIIDLLRPSDPTSTQSFSQWAHNLKGIQKNKMTQLHSTPEWFQILLRKICLPGTDFSNIYIHHKIAHPTRSHSPDTIPIRDIGNNILSIWTDGSLQKGAMGSGVIYTQITEEYINNQEHIRNAHIINEQCNRCTSADASSTKAELHGIYTALLKCKDDNKILLHLDSQVAIQQIHKMLTQDLTERELLKIPNYGLLTAIKQEIHRLEFEPTIYKVKAHSGIRLNERADRKANEGRQVPIDQRTDIIISRLPESERNKAYIYHKYQRTETYPSRIIKTQSNQTQTAASEDKLNRIWELDMDYKRTIQLTKFGMGRTNTETTKLSEHKFRINIINNLMHTMERATEWNQISDNRCRRCNTIPETQRHILECQVTKERHPLIIQQAITFFELRYKHIRIPKDIKNIYNLFDIIGLTDINILRTPIASGILTHTLMEYVQSDTPININTLTAVMDCWLSSLYKTVWLHRNERTFIKGSKNKVRDIDLPNENTFKEQTVTTKHRAHKRRLGDNINPVQIQKKIRNETQNLPAVVAFRLAPQFMEVDDQTTRPAG
jgi:ribonuclease HI